MKDDERRANELAARAARTAAALPSLAIRRNAAAAAMHRGSHGRRRKGSGDEFWQIRAAREGDPRRLIDWRRSARADTHFVRETELAAPGRVLFWADRSASMSFSSGKHRPKADRARLIALTTAMLLDRAEELFGLVESAEAPGTGHARLERMALELLPADEKEYGMPPLPSLANGIVVYISDFLGPWHSIASAVKSAAAAGLSGALVQVLDPDEQSFPFVGRTEFRSVGGSIRFETLSARGLREQYLASLERRKADLAALAENAGWQWMFHGTADSAGSAVEALHRVLADGR